MERYIRKFGDPAKNIAPQSQDEHENFNQVLDSMCSSFGEYPTNLQDFRSTLRIGAKIRATAFELHLG